MKLERNDENALILGLQFAFVSECNRTEVSCAGFDTEETRNAYKMTGGETI
jgi:hypothetical protein